MALTLLAGCTPANLPEEPAAESQCQELSPTEPGEAFARAADYLVNKQSTDGAWRSDVYATFREGDALTPCVLLALESLPEAQRPGGAIDAGLRFLEQLVGGDAAILPPEAGIAYPVYLAAGTILALGDRQDPTSQRTRDAWVRYLAERQLTEQNGWQPEDAFYGGWSYTLELPKRPSDLSQLSPLAEPNLSATVFALQALRSAGYDASSEPFRHARQFVERCQNFPASQGANSEGKASPLDDGGFFFVQSDAIRNKAGIAGHDDQGAERFASYGSTTADGLRALLLCGRPASAPRVVAACNWLKTHFSAQRHPGAFEVAAAGDAVYFYYCQSMAELLSDFDRSLAENNIPVDAWAAELVRELLSLQQTDGSWVNAEVEVREDDPLVATALALRAVALCEALRRAPREDQ